MQKIKEREKIGYLFLVPAIVLILVFIIYPVINTIYMSFFNTRIQTLSQGSQFIGFDNFKKVMSDDQFKVSLIFTLKFTVIAVFLETIIGMLFAVIMDKAMRFQGIVRASILIPWAIPTIVSGLMWQFMYSSQYGIVNAILIKLKIIGQSIPWLTDEFWATTATIIADVWKTTPYMSLLILAGLQTIPKQLYEAARIDGASRWQIFTKITLPLIKPILAVAILFRVLATFRIYDLVAVLTNGGPANKTASLSLYTINTYFNFGNISYGATLATVTFLISLLISFLFLNGLKEKIKGVE
ncbi:MAG: sugar ABC transporter permease [Firmicutes bacterium]|nr:sugar ABC transporter permease [Bacillota bacterium]